MKFVDFGDLVEVTYDDGNVELVSKEEAVVLGYRPKQEIRITYKGQIYNSNQFSKLTHISNSTIIDYYNKGLRTGEKMIEAHEKNTRQNIKIPYQGYEYTGLQFSALTDIPYVTIQHYYSIKRLRTGEEIISAYNKAKNNIIQIQYKNNFYTPHGLSKIIYISGDTIMRYYKKGYTTGEEIIAEYNKTKLKRQALQIPYQGQIYSSRQFSELTGISLSVVHTSYRKGCHTGEKIIEEYNKNRQAQCSLQIPFEGKVYSSKQFSNLTGISDATILKYYKQGLTTGEDIITAYNEKQQQKLHIPYNKKLYTISQFSKLTNISDSTIRAYYKKGLRTGEEILTYHSCSRQNYSISYQGDLYTVEQFSTYTDIPVDTIRIYRREGLTTGEEMLARYMAIPKIRITYNGNVYNSTQFSKLTGISNPTIGKYYKNGMRTGEEMIAYYNKQKMSKQKIKIAYQGKVYDSTQFSKLTGINAYTICKYYKKGLRTGEEMIEYYNRNKH